MSSVRTENLRIAVLGYGSVGRRHAHNLRRLGVQDLLVHDPDDRARRLAQQELNLRSVDSLEEIWRIKPSVVLISTPSHLHLQAALAGARAGCHLFVEKPLSHSEDGLDQLLSEVERRGLVTMVGCNMRFHPGPAVLKRLIEGGDIGQVLSARLQTGSYLPRWRPEQDYRRSYSASSEWGGAVLDCIHEIDLALWFFGPALLAGSAHLPARTLGLETDGLAEVLLRHQSGVLSSVHLNFVQRDYKRTCQLIGTQGTLYWDCLARRIDQYGEDGQLVRTHVEPADWDLNKMYLDEMSHYLECVLHGRPAMNPIAEGADALKLALRIRRQGGSGVS